MPNDMTPTIGHNKPPFIEVYADLNTDLIAYLTTDCADVTARTKELMAAFETVPAVLDAASAKIVSDQVAQITAHVKASEARREALVAPVLKAQRTINGFFAQHCTDKLDTPKQAAGIKQKLLARLTVHEQEVAAIERRRREEEERKAREAAAEAERIAAAERQRVAEAEARARREAEAAAAAIKNERDLARALEMEAAEKARQAEREAAAKSAAEAAAVAKAEAEKAAAAAAAKAADMGTVRGDYGSSSSLRTVWVARIENLAAVDLDAIRPFIAEDAIQKALNAYVKIHKDTKPVRGVVFRQETSAVVRG